jgi:hypothetical protein
LEGLVRKFLLLLRLFLLRDKLDVCLCGSADLGPRSIRDFYSCFPIGLDDVAPDVWFSLDSGADDAVVTAACNHIAPYHRRCSRAWVLAYYRDAVFVRLYNLVVEHKRRVVHDLDS